MNLTQRHHFEREHHKKWTDKRNNVHAIIHSVRQQNADENQIEPVEDILSSIEREQIQKLDVAFRKYEIKVLFYFFIIKLFIRIDLAQFQCTEAILLLQMYLSVSNSTVPVQKELVTKSLLKHFLKQCD